MRFTKMHGAGNCYIYINCFEEKVEDPAKLAALVSDMHFGVGADGLILICPSDAADARMAMYNADGSEGKMCGNGIRCVGKYVYDAGIARREHITIETLSGIKALAMRIENGVAVGATVDMGKPVLRPSLIPMQAEGESFINRPISANGRTYLATAISMGNPHCVVYVDDVDRLDLAAIGPSFERNPLFPERVNTEFIQVLNRGEQRMRVWERGSGETFACGTGACAAAVSGVLNGLCDREITMQLRGGDLRIEWSETDGSVYMTGGAQYICHGELDI